MKIISFVMLYFIVGCSSYGERGFLVSGVVVGSAGTLMLRNNGVNDLMVKTDGAFVFPKRIAGPYNVIVSQQPSNQTCRVVGGSGVALDNVTGIQVICDASGAAFSGTVDGLQGTMALQIEKGEKFTITQNGPFSFRSSTPAFDATKLRLVSKPFNQNCNIAGGGEDSEFTPQKVEIKCEDKQWHKPTSLADGVPAPNAGAVGVCMDTWGNIAMAWAQETNRVMLMERVGGKWTAPVQISPDGTAEVREVAASCKGGYTLVAWSQSDGSHNQIYVSEKQEGYWHHPSNASDNISPDGLNVDRLRVAVNAKGAALIAWTQTQSDGENHVYMSQRDDRGQWHHPSQPSEHISLDGYPVRDQASVAINASGDAIVIWSQVIPGLFGARLSRLFVSEYYQSSWKHPASSSDYLPSSFIVDHLFPDVAVRIDGRAVAAWTTRADSNGNALVYLSSRSGGGWQPLNILDTESLLDMPAYFPRVAANDRGHSVVVWSALSKGIFKSQYSVSVTERPTSTSDRLSPGETYAFFPQVALDNNDRYVVAWRQINASGKHQVYGADYLNKTVRKPASVQESLSLPDYNNSDPVLAVSDGGDAIIVWSSANANAVFRAEYK